MWVDIVQDTEDHITEAAVQQSATNIAEKGSILVVIRSGILARRFPVATAGTRLAYNQDIKAIQPDPAATDPLFLYYVLRAAEGKVLAQGVKKGATVHSIKSGFLEALPVPNLPLTDQRRIAEQLRDQLAQAENARAAVQAQFDAATVLLSAHLRHLFTSAEAQTWPCCKLGDLLRLRNEVVHPRDNPRGPATFVGLEHIQSTTGIRTGSLSLEMSELTGRKPRFRAGDIVYGYLRPYLNKLWIAEFDGLCSVDQYVYKVNTDRAETQFIAWYMRSPVYFQRAPIDTTPGQLPRSRWQRQRQWQAPRHPTVPQLRR